MTDEQKSPNVTWQATRVTRRQRETLRAHRGVILWFTGLSGAGKSTLAAHVEAALHQRGVATYLLDGDNVRHGLSRDLGFSPAHRTENIRRLAEVAKLFLEAGVIVLVAAISPYRADRELARAGLGADEFIEIYCRCDLATCEARDMKGLYRRARAGQISDFTGVNAPYEEPQAAHLVVDTGKLETAAAAAEVMRVMVTHGILT